MVVVVRFAVELYVILATVSERTVAIPRGQLVESESFVECWASEAEGDLSFIACSKAAVGFHRQAAFIR